MKRIILGLLLLIAFISGVRFNRPQQSKSLPPYTAPSNWKEIDLQHFLFYVPPDMRPEISQGIDSAVWRYTNNSIRLIIDWGQYPGAFESYTDQPEYKEEWIEIDGKTARFCSFRFSETHNASAIGDKIYEAAIGFADTETKGKNLTVWAACKTTDDLETAKLIFQSIRFK